MRQAEREGMWAACRTLDCSRAPHSTFIYLPHPCHTATLQASFIYLMRGSIQTQLNAYPLYTPAATWVPSSNLPCPGQCFSLTYFTFISTSVAVCWLQLLFDRRRSLVT